jgi:methylmalonyl-CoA mutase
MTDSAAALSFAAEFPEPDEARWRALAEASLKGAPWDKLVGRTADGVALQPLYREAEIATAHDEAGYPGAAPFVRGLNAIPDAYLPWHMRQAFEHPDPKIAHAEILADLERGVSSLELVISCAGTGGIKISNAAEMHALIDGVLVDLAPIALDAGIAGLSAAKWLAEALKDVGAAAAPPSFNMDPIGAQMRTGAPASFTYGEAAAFAATLRDHFPEATYFRADARPVHEAGGSEAQELGAALAAGISYQRALTEAKFSLEEAAQAILFTLSVGPDVLVETAKIRALRLAWDRVLEAANCKPEARGAKIHAVTSRRMMAKRDPWTNMLRTTAACFAGGAGGAQAVTVLPFTDALGLPSPFARRIARNTQLILMEESNLGRVVDPAGGSWFVEKMTRELAAEGWKQMQAIEAQGGIFDALTSGALAKEIEGVRKKREKLIATRRETVTGVTDFPLLGADKPDVTPRAAAKAQPLNALAPIRWAAPFEALADAGEAAGAKIFFANLGPLAEFSARSNFSRNLFAAGGVEAIEPEAVFADASALAASFSASGAKVAVLCGADARYATDAEAAAKALKGAGCDWIVYAGKPADEAAMRAVGVDQFIFAGQDALEALKTLHKALGL